MLHDKNILAVVAIALVIGLGTGYGIHGLLSPSMKVGGFPGGANGFGGASMNTSKGVSRSPSNGLLTGTVASKDDGSITIDTRDGSSRIVLVTPNTSVSKSATGSLNDVVVGSTIFISGTTNSDGSISASLIQLRPGLPPATMQ